ncbi:ABC transporter permease [Commensalibacter oyaizuii]|uniref:ABC transporter permease n=1 Tax=Commensalibacter oyaizuii TaxID=3043873 RepID=A0ABT6PYJ3_9PROT|nr:ABC transporter permease [Commensalibacter sp. TBRC 16381]MDI2089923.1 ABC transporter permease [Commensalibacter sp. TBRC 16381]
MMSDHDPTLPNEPVIDLRAVSLAQNFKLALTDLIQGTLNWRLNFKLGLLDTKLKYRGSILGPFWITIIMASKIGTIGFLYAYLLHISLHDYLPFISLSIILWIYISGIMNDSCSIFTNARQLILSTRIPYSVYAWRHIIAHAFIFLHNLVVIVIVFSIFKIFPKNLYLLPPAAFLWIADSLSICLLLGILGTRFKDIPPIVANITQALFFITPIVWKPSLLSFNNSYILLNPFYPLIEIIRGPILGEPLSSSLWWAAVGYSVVLWILTLLIFSKTRFRIPYWM